MKTASLIRILIYSLMLLVLFPQIAWANIVGLVFFIAPIIMFAHALAVIVLEFMVVLIYRSPIPISKSFEAVSLSNLASLVMGIIILFIDLAYGTSPWMTWYDNIISSIWDAPLFVSVFVLFILSVLIEWPVFRHVTRMGKWPCLHLVAVLNAVSYIATFFFIRYVQSPGKPL